MHQSRKELARLAIATAMKIRKQAGVSLHSLINIFDFSERFGVSVFFHDIPSMEGVYQADATPQPAIIVSSLRPAGRKALTCGHELGHHIFKHGTQWDELMDSRTQARRFEPVEFLVDVFSAAVQMPKLAVTHEFAKRSLDPTLSSAEDIYALSTLFGVSYSGFVTHMERSLGIINMRRASELTKQQPKQLRESLLGEACPQNLVIVDEHWQDKTIDIEVGDLILLPADTELEGTNAEVTESSARRTLIAAMTPGICRVSSASDWASFVRISRKDYVGRAPYRFDEEIEDDC